MTPAECREILGWLEVTCETCKGQGGWRREDDSWAVCSDCDGKRLVPTQEGLDLLAFIQRNRDRFDLG
jgi:hypothetical protein